MVLSGVAIAPALLVGGITLAIQGDKAHTQAQKYMAQVNCAVQEMRTNAKLLKRLERRAGELDCDPAEDAHEFQQAALLMRALAEVLDTPLLDADGTVSKASGTITERYAA